MLNGPSAGLLSPRDSTESSKAGTEGQSKREALNAGFMSSQGINRTSSTRYLDIHTFFSFSQTPVQLLEHFLFGHV